MESKLQLSGKKQVAQKFIFFDGSSIDIIDFVDSLFLGLCLKWDGFSASFLLGISCSYEYVISLVLRK